MNYEIVYIVVFEDNELVYVSDNKEEAEGYADEKIFRR